MNDRPVFLFALSFVVLWLSAQIGAFFRKRRGNLEEESRQDIDVVVAATPSAPPCWSAIACTAQKRKSSSFWLYRSFCPSRFFSLRILTARVEASFACVRKI